MRELGPTQLMCIGQAWGRGNGGDSVALAEVGEGFLEEGGWLITAPLLPPGTTPLAAQVFLLRLFLCLLM